MSTGTTPLPFAAPKESKTATSSNVAVKIDRRSALRTESKTVLSSRPYTNKIFSDNVTSFTWTGAQRLSFRIAPGLYNFSKTKLTFDMKSNASAGTAFLILKTDSLPFDSVNFQTGNSTSLYNIQGDAYIQSHVVMNAADAKSFTKKSVDSKGIVIPFRAPDGVHTDILLRKTSCHYQPHVKAFYADTALTQRVTIDMKYLGGVFAKDRLMYISNVANLDITIRPKDQVVSNFVSNAAAQTAQAAEAKDGVLGQVIASDNDYKASTEDAVINNIRLTLQQEGSSSVISQYRSRLKSGIPIWFHQPIVTSTVISSTSGQVAAQVNLSQNHGQYLQKSALVFEQVLDKTTASSFKVFLNDKNVNGTLTLAQARFMSSTNVSVNNVALYSAAQEILDSNYSQTDESPDNVTWSTEYSQDFTKDPLSQDALDGISLKNNVIVGFTPTVNSVEGSLALKIVSWPLKLYNMTSTGIKG